MLPSSAFLLLLLLSMTVISVSWDETAAALEDVVVVFGLRTIKIYFSYFSKRGTQDSPCNVKFGMEHPQAHP